jgi:hypothetical protein
MKPGYIEGQSGHAAAAPPSSVMNSRRLNWYLPQRGGIITVTGKGNKARMVPVLASAVRQSCLASVPIKRAAGPFRWQTGKICLP